MRMLELAEQLRRLVEATSRPLDISEVTLVSERDRSRRRRPSRRAMVAAVAATVAALAAITLTVLSVVGQHRSDRLTTGRGPATTTPAVSVLQMPSFIVGLRSDLGLV